MRISLKENSHHKFMSLALAQARKAFKKDDVPVGAVLVKDGRVLAKAHNRILAQRDPTAHAEILALRAAAHRLKNERLLGTILYTTLEPCPMCAGALVLSRVAHVVFAAWDKKAGAGGSLLNLLHHPRLNHRITVTAGVKERDSRLLLQRFFRQKRRKA